MKSILTIMTLLLTSSAYADYVAHEWGTFTSVIGSDGHPQDGMIGEDELLPEFVYNFGEDNWPSANAPKAALPSPTPTPFPPPRNRCNGPVKVPCRFVANQIITQKMETPVVYFYADQDQQVRFEVDFPQGIISQSYPAPEVTYPLAIPCNPLVNGYARYDLNILAPSTEATPVFVEDENIYSHARHTQSNLIESKTTAEIEKFIFYRGIGNFNPDLKVTSNNGSLTLQNDSNEEIPNSFLVYTDKHGRGAIRNLGGAAPSASINVSAENISKLEASVSKDKFISEARSQLIAALSQSGLYQDEAKAMVDTWEHGYFKTPGLRVLYILSRQEADTILPARLTPSPTSFERAFVGRLEVLTDVKERETFREIKTLGINFPVQSLGRLALPVLNRMEEIAKERGEFTTEFDSTLTSLREQL